MFHVKIEQDEDGIYIATVPALPGCVSDGRQKLKQRENIQEAMKLWLRPKTPKQLPNFPHPSRAV